MPVSVLISLNDEVWHFGTGMHLLEKLCNRHAFHIGIQGFLWK